MTAMKRIRTELVTLVLAAAMSLPASVAAQSRAVPSFPERAAAPGAQPSVEVQVEPERAEGSVLRIGQDYSLRVGDVVREVVVIAGTAAIDGRVNGDVVVVFGNARLSSTASIEGDMVVVGGSAIAMSGAVVRQDLVVVGGVFDAPAGFTPGGEYVVIGPRALGGRLEALVPWVTRGLLWGRPIVPDLPWVWGVVGLFFLVYLALNLVFDSPVRACAATLANKPLTAFLVGLLALLLTGPVCLLLAISVIGLAVVPVLLSALLVAGIVGKVGVARWIGMSVIREGSQESRLSSLRSFAIGFAMICLAYMVPVLGFVTWAMLGVFGLGAATLAFIAAYGRENPVPAPRVPSSVTPPRVADQEGAAAAPTPEAPAVAFSAPAPAVSAAPAMVSDLPSFPRAPFHDRLAAFVLDVILVVITQQLLDLTGRDGAVFLLLLGYHIGFWTWKGTTVGGIICQLRVVRVDGVPLRFVDALVRGLSSIFSLAVLGIGCLWILMDPERQAWHDKIAGTYVVKVPRNWPL